MPPLDRGLLARLDALVALVADRHGLALMPDGRLGAAEAPGSPCGPPASPARPAGAGGRSLYGTRWSCCGRWPRGSACCGGRPAGGHQLRNAWSQINESLAPA
jgi:hypothetical protein